jgi:hypothetical protein
MVRICNNIYTGNVIYTNFRESADVAGSWFSRDWEQRSCVTHKKKKKKKKLGQKKKKKKKKKKSQSPTARYSNK